MLTDSGLETWLVFHRKVDLLAFAAFCCWTIPPDDRYSRRTPDHLMLARNAGAELMLETPTWRADPDRGLVSATTPPRWIGPTATPWRSCEIWPMSSVSRAGRPTAQGSSHANPIDRLG